jgi:hypothetical protein
MPKKFIRLEVVPMEVVEKILKRQDSLSKKVGKGKVVVMKSRKAASKPGTAPRKAKVLSS